MRSKPSPVVRYVTAYDLQKNIGRALNRECSFSKPGEWICIMDGDICFLTPDWGRMVASIIRNCGDNYQLIGCMTNRLYDDHQLFDGTFSEDMDIRNHMAIARYLQSTDGVNVISTDKDIAGMFMLMPYEVWEKYKIPEGTIMFDRKLCEMIRQDGGKLGIATGLYVFHLYRAWSNRPKKDTIHLT